MKKTMAVLIALVLCIPVITFAADITLTSEGKVPETPFQNLQGQIDQLKTQLQNIQLTPGPQGPQGPAGTKVTGISNVVHGVIDDQGNVLAGVGFTARLGIEGLTAIYFTTPFTAPPTCVATATPGTIPNAPVCDINVLGIPGDPATETNIAVGCLLAGQPTGVPTAFRFICVQ